MGWKSHAVVYPVRGPRPGRRSRWGRRERPGKCKAGERERAREATARLEHTAGMQATADNFFASRLLPPPHAASRYLFASHPTHNPHTEAGGAHGIAESVRSRRPSYQIFGTQDRQPLPLQPPQKSPLRAHPRSSQHTGPEDDRFSTGEQQSSSGGRVAKQTESPMVVSEERVCHGQPLTLGKPAHMILDGSEIAGGACDKARRDRERGSQRHPQTTDHQEVQTTGCSARGGWQD